MFRSKGRKKEHKISNRGNSKQNVNKIREHIFLKKSLRKRGQI